MPLFLRDYLEYLSTIRGLSSKTIEEYMLDLRTFFRFLKLRFYQLSVDATLDFSEIDISDMTINDIRKVNLMDLHAFIAFVDKQRKNTNYTKRRKIAAIRTFFEYLTNKVKLLNENPAVNLESPKTESRTPVYLTLDESRKLLLAVNDTQNEFLKKRDYAMLMIFLNCGVRLSELVSMNQSDIRDGERIHIIGKGNKERVVYLNHSCKESLNDYLKLRSQVVQHEDALFLSMRKQRLNSRSVQHRVEKYLTEAGLDPHVFSVHKLRHTAATLMYKYGNVDILALKEILGHSSVATTQIYTHIDNEKLKQAVESNPLSDEGTSKSRS